MEMVAARLVQIPHLHHRGAGPWSLWSRNGDEDRGQRHAPPTQSLSSSSSSSSSLSGCVRPQFLSSSSSLGLNRSLQPQPRTSHGFCVLACLPSSSSPKTTSTASTKLYVSGLSFRTTEESLRNAFQNFGELVEVNLVMDRIAKRPRGFAFLRYATEEESTKAIEGMHGKFLDGRVIFVEVAKPRSELRQDVKQKRIQY